MKNNKNGFTLVELLAVIVILAIILVIAVPKVMTVIEDSKKATLESTTKMIASAAEKTKVQNTVLGKDAQITCENVAKLNDLDYETCDINFDDNTAKVTIKGKGKFEGLSVCEGTKNCAVILPSCDGITIISTKEDLLKVSENSSKGRKGLEGTFYLANDIDLDGVEFKTIAVEREKELTFIGDNHTISNAKVVESNYNGLYLYGMFYVFMNSILNITDLTLKNINVTVTASDNNADFTYAGVLCPYTEGNINLDNVDIIDSQLSTNLDRNGIYVTYIAPSTVVTMNNCDTKGSSLSVENSEKTGVTAAQLIGTLNITNCTKDIIEWDWVGKVYPGSTLKIN